MTVHVSFHENLTIETNQGKHVTGALGPQIGNADTLIVGTGKDNFGPADRDCMVNIKVETACRVAIGAENAVHNANSEWWGSGDRDARFVREGQYVSIVQPA